MLMLPFVRWRPCARALRADGSLAAFALFGLLGCASTSASASYGSLQADYDRSAPVPSRRARPETPISASAPVLERAAYVRAVLHSNPSIESARQGWRAALGRVNQAGAFEDPMLDLGVAPLSIGSSKAPFGYEVGISQKLPWFGKRSLEASIGAAEAEASKSDYESMKRELALAALVLYDQYFIAVRSLEINAHHIELMRAMRDGATAQFAAGRGSAQDALQAESELAHMEHDTMILRSQREITVAQMNELLHRAPELPLPPPPDELPLPPTPEQAPKHLEAEALQQRTDIAAARHRARAEQARADRAGREYYPDFTVSTSYNSMWDMPEHRWMVGLGFNLPIQTGRRTGAADEAVAMRAQFESDAARLTDSARTQVFVSLKQLEESRNVIAVFEKRLLPLAKDQIDAARAGFITSQNPFVAVIDAEKNLRGVELDYQMARADYDRRWGELERALGRTPGLDSKGIDR